MPRMLIAIMLWIAIVFVASFVTDLTSAVFIWFPVSFSVLCAYLGLEFFNAHRLVKGTVEGVLLSDLTKTIFWLSIVGSGKVMPNEFQLYYRNVIKTIGKMNSEFKANWERITQKYSLHLPVRNIYILGGIVIGLFGSVLGEVLRIEALSWGSIGLVLILFLLYAFTYKKGRESIESLAKDVDAAEIARQLAQRLILWTSEHAQKPLQVMLAQDNYSNIRVVGSTYATTIAEIIPKTVSNKKEAE
jgi:hypothetical protein